MADMDDSNVWYEDINEYDIYAAVNAVSLITINKTFVF